MSLDPLSSESILKHLTCSRALYHRRREFAEKIKKADSIVRDFACSHGWDKYIERLLFTSAQIFATQKILWNKTRKVTGSSEKQPPTDGFSAVICDGHLMAVAPEEYERLRPEYASIKDGWTKLLAHEMAHEFHSRLVGNEDQMGPQWFYEGFAMHVAGQHFDMSAISSLGRALEATHSESRGSYAEYIATFEFFRRRVGLGKMIMQAGRSDFESWLISSVVSASS
jgi:hypothetical protein